MTDIEIQNQKRYLKAPTLEQIDLVLEHLGVTAKHFEIFFNIYPNCLAQLHMKERADVIDKDGRRYSRRLPLKYWHLIFENLPSSERKNIVAVAKPKTKIKRAKKKKILMDEKILNLL